MKTSCSLLRRAFGILILVSASFPAHLVKASAPARLSPDLISSLLVEASGERVRELTAALAALARYPASQGFERAAEFVAERARTFGLKDVRILSFPTDHPAWDVRRGELWVLDPEPIKLADAADIPLSVAQYSRSADVEAEIVFVGVGTSPEDYRDKQVRGAIVLASGPPHRVEPLALVERGALGIISFAQSEFFGIAPPEDAVAWGRLSPERAREGAPGFAFMISPARGRALQERLARGERLRARVHLHADLRPSGQVKMVVAEIPGSTIRGQDIAFTAHLDHPSPGANDNASGSAVLLEIARVLTTLLGQGKIRPPLRTMRFWWVTEIESTYQYFFAHPEEAQRLLVNINIDQAGGDRHGRTDFVAIRQPPWMGTFADDVIRAVARRASELAPPHRAPSPLSVAPTGTRDPFVIHFWPYAPLSDHVVFETGGIDVPSISLAAPSLRYIHTSEDRVEHLDPTALKRMVFLGAACGVLLASTTARDLPGLLADVREGGLQRLGEAEATALREIAESTRENVHGRFKRAYYRVQQAYERESRILASLAKLAFVSGESESAAALRQESSFVWNLFALQEAAVRLLTEQYERTCRALGVAPRDLEPEADEVRLSRLVPVRTLPLGPEFRAWLDYVFPPLGPELSTLVKNLMDGQRNLAQIYGAALVASEDVKPADIEAFARELVRKEWIRLEERP